MRIFHNYSVSAYLRHCFFTSKYTKLPGKTVFAPRFNGFSPAKNADGGIKIVCLYPYRPLPLPPTICPLTLADCPMPVPVPYFACHSFPKHRQHGSFPYHRPDPSDLRIFAWVFFIRIARIAPPPMPPAPTCAVAVTCSIAKNLRNRTGYPS